MRWGVSNATRSLTNAAHRSSPVGVARNCGVIIMLIAGVGALVSLSVIVADTTSVALVWVVSVWGVLPTSVVLGVTVDSAGVPPAATKRVLLARGVLLCNWIGCPQLASSNRHQPRSNNCQRMCGRCNFVFNENIHGGRVYINDDSTLLRGACQD